MSSTLTAPLRRLFDDLPPAWKAEAAPFIDSRECKDLCAFVDARVAAGEEVYPTAPFAALCETSLAETRVVILGQDPYHGPGQAHGLAFSVPDGLALPPSLRNMFLELKSDLGCADPGSSDLMRWARQGVLLLNAVLTVESGKPNSHADKGWESFTDLLISAAARDERPRVFMLWGAKAQEKASMIKKTDDRHRILAANHPSPLSARRGPEPFLGCRHFSRANEFLVERGRGIIDWCGGSNI